MTADNGLVWPDIEPSRRQISANLHNIGDLDKTLALQLHIKHVCRRDHDRFELLQATQQPLPPLCRKYQVLAGYGYEGAGG